MGSIDCTPCSDDLQPLGEVDLREIPPTPAPLHLPKANFGDRTYTLHGGQTHNGHSSHQALLATKQRRIRRRFSSPGNSLSPIPI
eukprot:CAMPEP_0175142832 /NCGR_PEP_ID=MMETSP0087-20121206/13051_1 /TAXON_ID=136419 /ORGANISM="Unknown Unknown, Strain D1" /LENGTH=84 /DNA_ID=CAMNT_0016426745 /DNA_START=40 /DNA_END=294 /DNA_ORIENTATION=-